MKIFLRIMLSFLLLITSHAQALTGPLYWFKFSIQPDRFATQLWSSLPISSGDDSTGLVPNTFELGYTLNTSKYYSLGLLPNSPVIFYIDYPDYTGKIQHGCGFKINLINGYKADVQQIIIPNSAMDCSMSGDQNSSDFTIHISSYALSK